VDTQFVVKVDGGGVRAPGKSYRGGRRYVRLDVGFCGSTTLTTAVDIRKVGVEDE
jgi:hypothetical protein